MNRREFVSTLSAATAVATTMAAGGAETHARARKAQRILILGGTRFLGVHMTQIALERGHTITLFNRGQTNTDLFPNVEHLHGDRDGQLDALRGRKWDIVLDNSGYVPRHVKLSAELLAPSVGEYLFISTISVYASLATPNDEESAVGKMPDETVEKDSGGLYGPLKALCEKAAMRAMPGRCLVLRPGLIVGPDDNTDRFTYWPARAARGGEMVAPGSAADPIQFIDVRDLAAFALNLAEKRTVGTFNVDSPPGKFSMGDLLSASIDAATMLAHPPSPPKAVWITSDFLESQKIQPWSDMPAWAPEKGEFAGFARTSVKRALAAGLNVRPIGTTVTDTLAWQLTRPPADTQKLKAGLSPEREQQLLDAWHERKA